jgi:hypothetical protein
MNDYAVLEYLKLAIFYASWLYFPAAFLLIRYLRKRDAKKKILCGLIFAGLSVLAYARFIEPRILLTKRRELALERCFPDSGSVRLAFFADTHIGIFAHAMPSRRIADAVKASGASAVLIAGDFTYFLRRNRFYSAFAPFGQTGLPVFAVLGNHDVGRPGPDVGVRLKETFGTLGLIDAENQIMRLETPSGVVEIAGLSDLWERRQVISVLDEPTDRPRLLLTHQPKTVFELGPTSRVDLLLAGHTHGGQIYLPFLTCALIDMACNPVRVGRGRVNGVDLFVTGGTGMVGLPMRFLVPPRLDVIDLKWSACEG